MKNVIFKVTGNARIADGIYEMRLSGDTSAITAPGQFINIRLNGFYLRRPISVCDVADSEMVIVYKAIGSGTEYMSGLAAGTELDALTGLGNGFSTSASGNDPLLIGGGVGVPPLYYLAKVLRAEGKTVRAVLGFNTAGEIILADRFREIGCDVTVTTADGTYGVRGFVTDALPDEYGYFYACGPEPMLKAVFRNTKTSGELSFEERMGCGFGACMGCSCRTVTGYKRICRDGPVMKKEEIIW